MHQVRELYCAVLGLTAHRLDHLVQRLVVQRLGECRHEFDTTPVCIVGQAREKGFAPLGGSEIQFARGVDEGLAGALVELAVDVQLQLEGRGGVRRVTILPQQDLYRVVECRHHTRLV